MSIEGDPTNQGPEDEDDAAERSTPRGVWNSDPPGAAALAKSRAATAVPVAGAEGRKASARPSRPSPAALDVSTEGGRVRALHSESADPGRHTPAPTGAVAVAQHPPEDLPADATGSRPTFKRATGRVVPFHRAAPKEAHEVSGAGEHGASESRNARGASGHEDSIPRDPSDISITGEHSRKSLTRAKPPILASECLREDLEPTEPGRRLIRWVGAAISIIGVIGAVTIGELAPPAFGAAGILLFVASLCALPLKYRTRAVAVLATAAVGLVAMSMMRLQLGAPLESPILALGTLLLGGGLLHRGAYRASKTSRVFVAVGLALLLVWFLLSGGISGLTRIGSEWQSWGPAVARIGLALILLLSLLAFMDSSTTGAAQVWAASLLTWYGLHVALQLAVRTWPHERTGGGSPGVLEHLVPEISAAAAGAPSATLVAVTIASAALLIIGAIALAQTLAVLAGGTSEHRRRADEAAAAE